jgi:hypothetical protein
LEKVERQHIEIQGSVANGNMTFGDALTGFRGRLANDNSLKTTKQGIPRRTHRRAAQVVAGKWR